MSWKIPDKAPWEAKPETVAPTKLACFFCDGGTYNPDGICGECKKQGKSYEAPEGDHDA